MGEVVYRFPVGADPHVADSPAGNVSVVKEALTRLGVCRPGIRPPGRLLRAGVNDGIAGILRPWPLS